MLTEKEKYFTDLNDKQKKDIKKMFNEYLKDYSKIMDYKDAVDCAMHSTRQNASIMIQSYSAIK